jgi:hypothetical protein
MIRLGRCLGRAVIAAGIAGGLVITQGGVALAGSNCDAYAKLTLQQAKRNVAMKCGYTGPRWSLDARRHRRWCEEVGPAGWRAELKVRDQMLASCRR